MTKRVKKDWTRRGPRSKFITTSATPQEWQDVHVISRAMGMTVSACLRQLIKDQLYRLSTSSYIPSPEQKIDLIEVSNGQKI